MKLSASKVMFGPSVYADAAVVFHRLDGTKALLDQITESGGFDVILERLPGLKALSGSCGVADCFSDKRKTEPRLIAHLFEHVCVELQNLAGAHLGCVRSRAPHFARATAVSGAAVPYEVANVCEEAARLAIDLLNDVAQSKNDVEAPDVGVNSADSETFDFTERLDAFMRYAASKMLPVQDRFLLRTARALDIPDVRLVGRIIQLGHGRHQQRLSATKTSHTNTVSNDLAANKDYARRLLDDLGLPVPRSVRVYRKRDIREAAKQVGGYPVVVKPNNGSMGGGVSVGMKDSKQALLAYDRARKIARSVLVEEVVEGSDFRMLVINGKLCAASERVPGHIVGDGEQTVEALVAEVNRDPRRGDGPTQSWTRIELDDQADRLLAELGYDHQSVPAAGEIIFLRRNANTSDGGTSIDVTDIVHPDNRDIAVRTAKAIGLDIAGVDILTTDISKSMWKTDGKICEINSRPGLRKHIWPHTGKRRDVMTPIIDMLFPAGHAARIPIIAVTGTGDTRTATRMIEHVLTASGRHVGLMLNRRVYSGAHTSTRRKMKPAEAMRMIFLDPEVDVAVFELTPKDVLRHGLGCDAIDVTAVINSPSVDSTSEDFASLQDAIGVVARATRGAVYVDESNSSSDDAASKLPSEWRVRVTDSPTVPRPELGAHTQRVAVDGNTIAIYRGSQAEAKIPMIDPSHLHSGEGSDEDAARLRNGAVFASLCAFGLEMDPKDVYRSLASYSETPKRAAKKRARKREKKAAS